MGISDNYNEPDIPDYIIKEAQEVTVQLTKTFNNFHFISFWNHSEVGQRYFFNVKVVMTYVDL